ncbi:hypothetical protein EVAR_12964_1 [Eumeta japonica]|uniref:Uncharacterized protein n=1 Tax=Eumeta variegata TaxID=151549 RepID=A0A4C1TWS3_EUMVA|nr:hypothetical protein EVAR_12964_1 [Eumeta japonica]
MLTVLNQKQKQDSDHDPNGNESGSRMEIKSRIRFAICISAYRFAICEGSESSSMRMRTASILPPFLGVAGGVRAPPAPSTPAGVLAEWCIRPDH